MLGGRVAEEVAMDDITTGAENDLIQQLVCPGDGHPLGNGQSGHDGFGLR